MKTSLKLLSVAGIMLASALVGTSAFADDRPDITVAIQNMGPAGSLDTTENTGTAGRKYLNMIFEQLIELDLSDPNLPAHPGLATEWHWVEPTTLELKLREGVKFHNGDEMTADDVVFSFSDERYGRLPEQNAAREAGEDTFTRADGSKGIVPPASVAAGLLSEWPLLDHVEKVDDYTVRFITTEPTLALEARLARVNYAAIISKRAFLEAASWSDFTLNPVSTGPYKVDNVDRGNAVHLVSNDDYWNGLPPIKKLDIMVVPEAASRINGLMSGEYDIVSDLGSDQVSLLDNNDDFDIVGGPVANIRFIALDTRNGPLQNKLVRQALSHAIDRETIVDVLWNGLTYPAKGLQHPLFADLYVDDFETPAYDPELAKKLLAESGYKGEPITYHVANNYYPNEVTIAQYNLDTLTQIGFNIEFSIIDNWYKASSDRMMFDLSNTAYFAHPAAILANNCPNGSYNTKTNPEGVWQNDEFDELCGVINSSTDKAEVKAATARALEILEIEDPQIITLHQNAILYGKRADINFTPSAMFVMDFRPGSFSIED